MKTNAIYEQVVAHLNASENNRVVACTSMAGSRSPVYAPKDLKNIKPEGNGLRVGKLFIFAAQIRLAHIK